MKNKFAASSSIFELPISVHAKIVYLYLCSVADSNGQSSPSRNTIAEMCKISPATVSRATDSLVEHGLVTKTYSVGNENEYTVTALSGNTTQRRQH